MKMGGFMMKVKDMVTGLLNKVDETTTGYEKALDAKHEALAESAMKLTETKNEATRIHKLVVLDGMEQSVYDKALQRVVELEDKIEKLQHDIELIEKYKTDDVVSVIAEIEANKKIVMQERGAEIQAIQKDMLVAKQVYLQTMVKAGERYKKAVASEHKIETLKDKLGLKNRMYYLVDADSALFQHPSAGASNSYIYMMVDRKEVNDALSNGRIASQLTAKIAELNK